MITIEQITYKNWNPVWRLANQQVELLIPAGVGPRILRYGRIGGVNQFVEFPEQAGVADGGSWRLYGGHRLWHSPEDMQRTYYPDQQPIGVEETEGGLRLLQPEEPTTRLQKSIEIVLDPDTDRVTVTHKIANNGLWPVCCAAWAISAMAPGGCSFVRQRTRRSQNPCLPDVGISIWPHTSLADPRVTWGDQFILLRQDPDVHKPFKAGLAGDAGWVAYLNGTDLFVKTAAWQAGARYPDNGAAVELYTCDAFSEIETLSPLQEIATGETVSHQEQWRLLQLDRAPAVLTESELLSASWLP